MDLEYERRKRELKVIGKLSDEALLVFWRSYQSGINGDYDAATGDELKAELVRRGLLEK